MIAFAISATTFATLVIAFATLAIAYGASPKKVAYWLEDTVQTVFMYYCHPDVTKSEATNF
ncbi:hypothetical protein [Nostoc sp.]|uniref:hypothetical protein n=1 Tax=Nostoc sp. TaxID=1180 RepID=UPI002FFC3C18